MTSTRSARPVVATAAGAVRGLRTDDVVVWRGIPYAAPPVGALRWTPPQPASAWSGVRDGSRFGARAPQVVPAELVPPAGDVVTDDDMPLSEDCLYLNVCAPERIPAGGAPVLVWIHGGGYHFGSGPNLIGDGAALARAGIVVVTLNYRLGSFGFLDLSSLLGARYAASGNCGLLDQVAALRWVRANIAAFGGDAHRVTVAGVSAGAKSVINLMATPEARGLFRRGISQSGGDHVVDRAGAAALARRLLHGLGIVEPTPELLVSLPTSDVLAAQQEIATGARATWVWRPVVDGTVLPATPTRAFAAGRAAGIALMAGTTRHESHGYDVAEPTAAGIVPDVLDAVFAEEATSVLDLYTRELAGAPRRDVLRAVMTDERYAAPTLRLLDAQSAHGQTWRYLVDEVDPDQPGSALHGADVPLVWKVGLERRDPRTPALGAQLRATWTSFVHGGGPAAAGLPTWPEYRAERPATMVFGFPSRVDLGLTTAERAWRDREWTPGAWWPEPAGDVVRGTSLPAPVSP